MLEPRWQRSSILTACVERMRVSGNGRAGVEFEIKRLLYGSSSNFLSRHVMCAMQGSAGTTLPWIPPEYEYVREHNISLFTYSKRSKGYGIIFQMQGAGRGILQSVEIRGNSICPSVKPCESDSQDAIKLIEKLLKQDTTPSPVSIAILFWNPAYLCDCRMCL